MFDNIMGIAAAVDLFCFMALGAAGDVVAVSIQQGPGLVIAGKNVLAKLFLQLISWCKKRKYTHCNQSASKWPQPD